MALKSTKIGHARRPMALAKATSPLPDPTSFRVLLPGRPRLETVRSSGDPRMFPDHGHVRLRTAAIVAALVVAGLAIAAPAPEDDAWPGLWAPGATAGPAPAHACPKPRCSGPARRGAGPSAAASPRSPSPAAAATRCSPTAPSTTRRRSTRPADASCGGLRWARPIAATTVLGTARPRPLPSPLAGSSSSAVAGCSSRWTPPPESRSGSTISRPS